MALKHDIHKAYEFLKEGELTPVSREAFVKSLNLLNVQRTKIDSWFEEEYMAWRYVERWVLAKERERKIILVITRMPTANSENCVWCLM